MAAVDSSAEKNFEERKSVAQQRLETVAVIGAGLSGVVAARRLKAAGMRVHIVEKSRGAGGRMATRRAGSLAFDHGAQYFRPVGAAFRAEVAAWVASGIAAPWSATGEAVGDAERFVGAPSMTAPVRAIARNVALTTGFTVSCIEGGPGAWMLRSAEGACVGPVDAVLVSAPAPQAAALIEPVAPALAARISMARYTPCLTLMLAYDPHGVVGSPRVGRISDHAAVGWIADDGAKPGRAPGAPRRFVAHATPDWSRAHLDESPDLIAAALLSEVGPLIGARATTLHVQVHRWRYALVETAIGEPCLWDPETGLGACGDWCIAGRVEAAFDSGAALAEAVVATRESQA